MTFPFGETVIRERRHQIPDPYNPQRTVPGSWDDADEETIDEAWVAASSSTQSETATRNQILTEKSLYCAPDADIRRGDRIRADGETYYVVVKPAADRNPFTGWQPVLEVPLENQEG